MIALRRHGLMCVASVHSLWEHVCAASGVRRMARDTRQDGAIPAEGEADKIRAFLKQKCAPAHAP